MAGKTGNILALYDVLYRRTDEEPSVDDARDSGRNGRDGI